jgi:(2Fe-2S) ferredoxin
VTGDAAAPVEPRTLVLVCHGPSCSERGSPETCRLLKEAVANGPARRSVRVSETGCLDSCATGPNVLVASEGAVQTGVKGASVAALVAMLTGAASVG